MKIGIISILVCVLALAFASCGTKPAVQKTVEKPTFQIKRVVSEERKVVVAFPVLEAAGAMKDSVFQVYSASYVYADSAWNFQESGSDYKVETTRYYPYVYGYIVLPRPKYLTGGDWYAVRVWVKTEAGTRLAVWPGDPCSRQDGSERWGYEFVVNMETGENHPVPKRE